MSRHNENFSEKIFFRGRINFKRGMKRHQKIHKQYTSKINHLHRQDDLSLLAHMNGKWENNSAF